MRPRWWCRRAHPELRSTRPRHHRGKRTRSRCARPGTSNRRPSGRPARPPTIHHRAGGAPRVASEPTRLPSVGPAARDTQGPAAQARPDSQPHCPDDLHYAPVTGQRGHSFFPRSLRRFYGQLPTRKSRELRSPDSSRKLFLRARSSLISRENLFSFLRSRDLHSSRPA